MRNVDRSAAVRRRRWLLVVLAAGLLGSTGWGASTPPPRASRAAAARRAAGAARPPKSAEEGVLQTIDVEANAPVRIELERFSRVAGDAGIFSATLRIDNRSDRPLAWRATLVGTGTEPWQRRRGRQAVLAGFSSEAPEMVVPAGSAREFPLRLPQPGPPQNLTLTGPFVANSYIPLNQWEVTGPLFSPAGWSAMHGDAALGGNVVNSVRQPAGFPKDWRVLEPFPAIVMDSDELTELDSEQVEAIRGYVARGGQLGICGEVDAEMAPPPVPAVFGVPRGPRSDAYAYGFGRVGRPVFSFGSGPHTAEVDGGLQWLNSPPEWLQDRLPRWPLYGVLVLTAVLAGPVSFLWLARRRGRHWVFVTLPLIALGATGALVVVILLHDGTGGHGRRFVQAVLLEGRPEMIVRQTQGARSGWLNSREFTVPEHACLSFAATGETAGALQLRRDGARCAGDWFRNRTATAQVITHDVPTRASLVWRGSDAHPAVVSTFSTALEHLVVRRADGQWHAARVEPGRETALEKLSSAAWMELRREFTSPFASSAVSLLDDFEVVDGFIARTEKLEGAPIETLSSVRWTDLIVVSGRCTKP